MANLDFNGTLIATDDEGFLLDQTQWSQELMHFMALKDGLTLTENHIAVIEIVRNYHQKYATTPAMRALIALLRQEGYAALASSLALARLFPQGAAKSAARYAGLTKPVKCI